MTSPVLSHTEFFGNPDLYKTPIRLTDDFLSGYAALPSPLSTMAEITYQRTYAREFKWSTPRIVELAGHFGLTGDREEWWLTCARVVEGLVEIVQRHQTARDSWDSLDALEWSAWAQTAYEELYNRRWSPSGRGLTHLGAPSLYRHGGAVLYNCAAISTAKMPLHEALAWLMDMSMLGVGVGFDVDGAGLMDVVEPYRHGEHIIEDSREGWVTAAKIAVGAWLGFNPLPTFRYHLVRKKGTPINGFGGVAEGPDPLIELLEVNIPQILSPFINQPLPASAIVHIMNAGGKCVVSGNVRRSAELALGDWWSEEFANLKDKSQWGDAIRNYGWMSNNSKRAPLGANYDRFVALNAAGIDLGVTWIDNVQTWGRIGQNDDYVLIEHARNWNPCVEIALEHGEGCNVNETVPQRCSPAEFSRVASIAFAAGKIISLVPIHDPLMDAVQRKNRRVGVGITGVRTALRMDPNLPTTLDAAYRQIAADDVELSAALGVPLSKRRTCAKPGGTVPKVLDVVSGISAPTARYILRAVTFAADHPAIPFLIAAGYSIRPSVATPNSVLVEVPMDYTEAGVVEADLTAREQLELAALIQHVWADNGVSSTCKVADHEWGELSSLLDEFQYKLKAMSFLAKPAASAETLATLLARYPDLPEIPLTKAEYEARTRDLQPVLWREIKGMHDTNDGYCDSDRCLLPAR